MKQDRQGSVSRLKVIVGRHHIPVSLDCNNCDVVRELRSLELVSQKTTGTLVLLPGSYIMMALSTENARFLPQLAEEVIPPLVEDSAPSLWLLS